MSLPPLGHSLVVIVISLSATTLCAQGVEPYPLAVTNRLFYQKSPMKPPSVNTPFSDPDLGGLMVRATDENTNPRHPVNFFRNPAQDVNEWSRDNRKFYVVGGESTNLAFAFDPASMILTALPGAGKGGALLVPLRGGPTFSFLDSDLMYGTMLTAPLTIATFRFSTETVQPLFDTTACNTQPSLVAGPKVSSSDNTISDDDNRIVISAGANAFGKRPFVIVYDQNLGCRWYNTQTGQVGGQWGPIGQVGLADRFLINHAKISGNGRYVRIAVVTPGFTGFYIWDLESLNVQACKTQVDPALHCGGYAAMGYDSYINTAGSIDELNTVRRPLSDVSAVSPLISPFPEPHFLGQTDNFAWNNGRLKSTAPMCGTTFQEHGDKEVKEPFDGEVFCIETDGLGSTIWRFAHNRTTWDSEYYWTQPYGNLSLDGEFFAFTSDWDNQVGTFGDGDPRTDVWIVRLQ